MKTKIIVNIVLDKLLIKKWNMWKTLIHGTKFYDGKINRAKEQ